MSTEIVQAGTVGLVVRLIVADYDPAQAHTREIRILRPRGQPTIEVADVPVGVASDGRPCLEYVTQEGDLDIPGRYTILGYLEDGAGRWPTRAVRFFVQARR
jgi:hypothetical protein